MLIQGGVTALMITAWVGDEAIFDLLVEHNADVTKKVDVSFHLRDVMLCSCTRSSGFVCVMCLCCYCWCLCGGVLLGVLLSVCMQ